MATYLIQENIVNLQFTTRWHIAYPVISFSVGLARPKSKIFSSQSSLTAMLEGLRSLKSSVRNWCLENLDYTCEWFLQSEHTSSPWQSGRPRTVHGHQTVSGSGWCCSGQPPSDGSPCNYKRRLLQNKFKPQFIPIKFGKRHKMILRIILWCFLNRYCNRQ